MSGGGGVNLLQFEIGAVAFACDMSQVASVLNWQEAQGIEQLSPWQNVGLAQEPGGHVALLRVKRQLPLGLCIGTPRGVKNVGPKDVLFLPPWLHPFLWDHLAPVVLNHQGPDALVWLLSLSSLLKGHRR